MTNLTLLAQADANNGGDVVALFGGLGALGIVFLIATILATVFWLWMLIDVVISHRPADEKILWFLVVFFLHLIGALIYFFVGRNRTAEAVGGPGTV